MSKTSENLKQAIEGESQAYVRYLAFSEKADEEGFAGAARLFRATAKAEWVHANSHQKALGGQSDILENLKSPDKTAEAVQEFKSQGNVGSTMENLKTALDGENHEFKTMYPAMIKDAVDEQETEARYSLEYAMSIEMVHAGLFKKALADPLAVKADAYYVCPVCGHTAAGKAPKKCPYCGVDASKFMETT
jgi:rubrerythrin